MNSTAFLKSLGSAAAEAFGHQLASELVDRFACALKREPEAGPRTVSPLAIQSYARGSPFAHFNAYQVEAWAADQLGHMDAARARLVLSACAPQLARRQ